VKQQEKLPITVEHIGHIDEGITSKTELAEKFTAVSSF
jgi:hypothetical protein